MLRRVEGSFLYPAPSVNTFCLDNFAASLQRSQHENNRCGISRYLHDLLSWISSRGTRSRAATGWRVSKLHYGRRTNALKNLTTGAATGVGWYSLFSATTASFNT